jgi:hypothetical protein
MELDIKKVKLDLALAFRVTPFLKWSLLNSTLPNDIHPHHQDHSNIHSSMGLSLTESIQMPFSTRFTASMIGVVASLLSFSILTI